MSLSWKKAAALAVTVGVIVTPLVACSSSSSGGNSSKPLIGVFMPTTQLPRWNRDGAELKKDLEADGLQVSLQFADNKNDQQISQIQTAINDNAKVLVIASIDGTTLGPTLQTAASKGIKVIAYDRLILNTADVDYYATFDNEKVGTLQGQYIETQLDLKDGKGPFNFEAFAGSPDDNNAAFFFKGAYDVLKPYVDKGQLVSVSGKWPTSADDWKSIGIQGWASDAAQSEMQNRLNSFYTGGKHVDVVLSPNDSLALGISKSLQDAGYTSSNFPVLTGQDADQANTVNILNGLQSMTVWKDTRALATQAAKMVNQIITNQTVDVNNTKDYNNGNKVVPSYLLDPKVVTKDTVESILVESGFWTKKDLGLS